MFRDVNSRFSELPGIDIERSKFNRPFQHKTTFNAGDLVPFFVDEVLPGDTFSVDMASLVRMTTPIFPTMDNAFLDTYFFFVPNRLVWKHWKEFNGENSEGYWANTTEYQIPQLVAPSLSGSPALPDSSFTGWQKGDVMDYFGIPTNVDGISVSALPLRAYILIWNEWFRDQNTMAPAYFSNGDETTYGNTVAEVRYQNDVASESQRLSDFDLKIQNAYNGSMLLPVSKYHDYFTSTLPSPLKSAPVSIPLFNEDLKVKTGKSFDDINHISMKFVNSVDGSYNYGSTPGLFYGGTSFEGETAGRSLFAYGDTSGVVPEGSDPQLIVPNNLYADVQNVAVATISQLRQAFQLQRLFEKDARGGTRYREILKSHFGVDSPDARMQVPEYLGGKRIPINIDQVLQTSSTDSVSPQGNTAAYSMTSDIDSSFTKSFTEHGLIIGVCCVRTDHTYQQGIERFWSRKNRFDFYWPSLAHISEQAVLVKEIFAQGSASDDDAFGYQEAWADYRYKPNRVSGAFRSNFHGTLDSWHYADYYTGRNSDFVLDSNWLSETKNNIDRTLAVSSSLEDQFLADFYVKMTCVRPMPLYSVPGLIDHY